MKRSTIAAAAIQWKTVQLGSWADFESAIEEKVKTAALLGSELIVFPEYFFLHATVFLPYAEKTSFAYLQQYIPRFIEYMGSLAKRYKQVIVAGTVPVKERLKTCVNRAYVFDRGRAVFTQDKLHLTPFEKGSSVMIPSKTSAVIQTSLGNIGVLICYDCEFPNLAKSLVQQGADILVVPSCTETLAGYYRVSLSCRARAVENQCFVVQSALVGQSAHEWISDNKGRSGIYSPCENGFPANGILAEGVFGRNMVVCSQLDLNTLSKARQDGEVTNYLDYTIS